MIIKDKYKYFKKLNKSERNYYLEKIEVFKKYQSDSKSYEAQTAINHLECSNDIDFEDFRYYYKIIRKG